MTGTRACLYHAHLDRRGEPAHLAPLTARAAGGVLRCAGGWRIVGHQEDRASGTRLDRPGLQAALDLARTGATPCCSSTGSTGSLIDHVAFHRARRLLGERGDDMALRRSNPSDFLLTGLIRCRRAYVGMSARGNGGTYHYYAYTGRQKLGCAGGDGERIPRDKLESAVPAPRLALPRRRAHPQSPRRGRRQAAG